jgi:serine/threonine protein kinase
MALANGTRLGPYEILEPLGAGGMGEVYRARDTRLDRTVAIKVLPDELAADAQLKANDIGEEDGQSFLVMEYLSSPPRGGARNRTSYPLALTGTFAQRRRSTRAS